MPDILVVKAKPFFNKLNNGVEITYQVSDEMMSDMLNKSSLEDWQKEFFFNSIKKAFELLS